MSDMYVLNSLATNSNTTMDEVKNTAEEVVQISSTQMDNDANSGMSTFNKISDLSPPLLKTAEVNFSQDISRFLEKPQRIRSGTWNSSTVGTFIAVDCPFEQLSKPVYRDKVSGYLAFRATLHAKLQVNAQRFIQGRLIMHWIPQAQVAAMRPNMRNVNLQTITQQPCVELDASCDTEVELMIPYTSPTTHYNLLNGAGPFGGLYVTVYYPIETGVGGSAECEYTLWTYFTNVELVTPTVPGTFLSQCGLSDVHCADFERQDEITISSCYFESQSGRRAITSSKRKKKKDPSDVEIEQAGKGPISSALTSVSTAAGVLTGIPMISSVAGTVSWAAGIASGVASYFGYSNPRNEEPVHRVVSSVNPYMSNCDGGDYSQTHGLSIQNKVELLSGFAGTDIDESSLAYILSIPTYFETIIWSVTDNPGDLKYRQLVSPRASEFRTNIGGGATFANLYTHTPVSFFSKMFSHYRGSIGIRLKFVKTEFHSGRLCVAYSPGNTSLTGNVGETDYLLREIIDVRECNEYSFILPYAAVEEYKRVDNSYCQFDIYVINSLVAPETVSQSIGILMEVYAADDFELAFPKSYELYNDNFHVVIPNSLSGNFVSQSGGMGERQCVKLPLDNAIGSSSITDEGLAPSKFCIGERITSVNQLLKRSTMFKIHDFPQTGSNVSNMRIKAHDMTAIVEIGSTVFFPVIYGEQLSLIGMCYLYTRGSVRWRWYTDSNTNRRIITTLSEGHQTNFVEPNITFPMWGNASSLVADQQNDGGAYVEVPQYNRLHSKLNRVLPPADIYDTTTQLNINVVPQVDIEEEIPFVFRCAGDDLQLGFFIGCPVVASA